MSDDVPHWIIDGIRLHKNRGANMVLWSPDRNVMGQWILRSSICVPDVVNVDDVYLPYIWLPGDQMCIAIGNVAVKTDGSVDTKTNLTD